MSAPYVDREKQLRSVFVGNIPFDVTEADLRDKFEQAGPIVSFRLVHDRESGKPKGYGFIEYQDVATANSCVRNLNNVEYNGRPLRVGPAAGGDHNAENIKALQQALGGLQQESPYGEAVEPTEAPEAISKAVSSLPPEQMFELMKQMKLCIQNNPNEARNMLLQNPQLAYALLQAQIVMKIVDPQVAMALLHRERDSAPALKTDDTPKPVIPSAASATNSGFRPSGGLLGERPGEAATGATRVPGLLDSHGPTPSHSNDRWGGGSGGPSVSDPRAQPSGMQRNMDPRIPPQSLDPRRSGMDPRDGPGMDPRGRPGMDPRGGLPGMDHRPGMDPRGPPMDRRDVDRRDMDYRGQDYNRGGDPRDRRPPQGALLDHPRSDMRHPMGGPGRSGPPGSSQFSPRQGGPPGRGAPSAGGSADEDKEKAALIMQVLQLTDEQIQQLPNDQRQSILILKQQIAGGR